MSFDGTADVDIAATVVGAFDGDYGSLTNVPAEFTPAAHTHAISEVTNLQTELDAKATTGKAIAMAIVFG